MDATQQNGLQQSNVYGESSGNSNCSDRSSPMLDNKTNLIVNYLPQHMTQDEVRSLFSSVGEIESCKLIRNKSTGQSLGYSFVNFRRQEDAERALYGLNGLKLQGKVIKVSYARPSSESIKNANLYVSGFPKTMTQPELERIFSLYGNIITSRILTETNPMDQQLNNSPVLSKGVGFIRYDQRVEAERAINNLNGTTPEGFTESLIVKFANNPGNNVKAPTVLPPHVAARMSGQLNPMVNRYRYYPLSPSPEKILNAAKGVQRYSMYNDILPDTTAASMILNNVVSSHGWCLFVYNLGPETDEYAIWKLFGPFGAVLNVTVIRDNTTNKCKGFGFVTMAKYDDALSAMQMLNGCSLDNRILQVSFKTNRKM